MANPNLAAAGNIFGKTDVLNVTTTATAITSNAANSGKVLKINALVVASLTGYPSVTVDLFRSSTAYKIANAVTVPAGSSVVILSKENPVYLMEGDSLRLTASAATSLTAVCSYEEIY